MWTLGITAGQQVRRLVAAAQGQGKSQFAALLPESDFGHAMGTALNQATASSGAAPPTVRFYASGMPAINAAARDLSGYANRRGPIDAQMRAARALGTPEGRRQAQELAKSSIPPPSFNTLLLADTGEALTEIAAVLPYYDVDRSAVQIIGPALWASGSSGSGQFRGAWYAAPDPAARANFEQAYTAKYGSGPPPLADLAYDAASIARVRGRPRLLGGRAGPAVRVRRRRWLVRAAVGRPGAPGAGGVRHRARRAADGRAGAAVGQCAGSVTTPQSDRTRSRPLPNCPKCNIGRGR